MQDFVDTAVVELRSRYAECSLIELTLTVRGDGRELVGAFQARRDGIIRRHAYRMGKAADNVAAQEELRQAVERFRGETDRITRLQREQQ